MASTGRIRLPRYQTSLGLLPSPRGRLSSRSMSSGKGENSREAPPRAHIRDPEFSLSPQGDTSRRRLPAAKPRGSLRSPCPAACPPWPLSWTLCEVTASQPPFTNQLSAAKGPCDVTATPTPALQGSCPAPSRLLCVFELLPLGHPHTLSGRARVHAGHTWNHQRMLNVPHSVLQRFGDLKARRDC